MISGMCAALALISACDGRLRGKAGESCGSRDDCGAGLQCFAGVCVSRSAASSGAGDAGVGGMAGGACSGRADCMAGLRCLENVCGAAAVGMNSDWRYGGRGESCAGANDCQEGLSCIAGTCREATLGLSYTGRECVRVECEEAADCCENFAPSPDCEIYQANCETDPIFCNTYRSLCVCSQDCVDALCVARAPGCSSDEECLSQQTPFCVDEQCVQCGEASDCPGVGTICTGGACLGPCSVDENCPPLHACREGECVDVGCQSDRECVFLRSDALAVCREGACDVPCVRDSDCAEQGTSFEVCLEGRCEFVGCEGDAECRALLMLQDSPGDTRAICR